MAEHFRFFDAVETNGQYDREYNAQEFTDYFKALVTTGVMKGAGNQLEVTTNGSNMVTSINTGIAFILGRYYENDAPLTFTHDTETLGLNRIDRIVIRMDQNVDARHVKAFLKKGTASTNPVPPALTQNNTVYEISLAQIRVTGGQTFIAVNAVTDERGTDVICPWAGSNILPSFNDNALSNHIDNAGSHIYFVGMGVKTADTATNTFVLTLPEGVTLVNGLGLSFQIPTGLTSSLLPVAVSINGTSYNVHKTNASASRLSALGAPSILTIRYASSHSVFFVQGEGGDYGNATAAQVLSGRTFGTDSGVVNGTMRNNSSDTTIGTRRTSASGYIDISPMIGYYDGGTNSKTRISDSNFTAANIKSGVSMFGLTGNFTGNYYNSSATQAVAQGTNTINYTNSFAVGFVPKYYLIRLSDFYFNYGGNTCWGTASCFYNGTGKLITQSANLGGSIGYLVGMNDSSSISGTNLNTVFSVSVPYSTQGMTMNVNVYAWG